MKEDLYHQYAERLINKTPEEICESCTYINGMKVISFDEFKVFQTSQDMIALHCPTGEVVQELERYAENGAWVGVDSAKFGTEDHIGCITIFNDGVLKLLRAKREEDGVSEEMRVEEDYYNFVKAVIDTENSDIIMNSQITKYSHEHEPLAKKVIIKGEQDYCVIYAEDYMIVVNCSTNIVTCIFKRAETGIGWEGVKQAVGKDEVIAVITILEKVVNRLATLMWERENQEHSLALDMIPIYKYLLETEKVCIINVPRDRAIQTIRYAFEKKRMCGAISNVDLNMIYENEDSAKAEFEELHVEHYQETILPVSVNIDITKIEPDMFECKFSLIE